jgi:DNA-binding LacI/PurR family transcriptional regulator
MEYMSKNTEPKTPSEKMHDYRKRMRESGLRLVQFWIPDERSKGFSEEAKRQSLRTRFAEEAETESLDFIEQVADW